MGRREHPEVDGLRGRSAERRGSPSALPRPAAVAAASATSSSPTREELDTALRAHHGNVASVARAFGKERMQIHRWAKRHGLTLDAYRPTHEAEAPPPRDPD